MSKEFYSSILPAEGSYCVAVLPPNGNIRHHFVDSIDDLVQVVEEKKQDNNVFFGLAGFDGHSRKNALALKSFFVDLDVGDTKDYGTKSQAFDALKEFIQSQDLPPPTITDSGNGIHAYWPLDKDVDANEWKLYAEKFKQMCLSNGLKIDPAVSADKARILRCPNTFNLKSNPPTPTKVIEVAPMKYQYRMFQNMLGQVEKSFEEILKDTKLTETSMVASGLNNYKSKFETIANKSLDESSNEGCLQIRYCIRNRANLPEPLWYAALSIAQHCEDRDKYIHALSQDYKGYNKEATERKANQTQGMPQSCKVFDNLNPGICEGCTHYNKITNPLSLGKVFVPSIPTKNFIRSEVSTALNGMPTVTTSLVGLPPEYAIEGYYRGQNGGIYRKPKPVYDESGQLVEQKERAICAYDFYPLKRVYSSKDGYCLLMKYDTPHDTPAEFYVPFSTLYDGTELRKLIAKHGVLFDAKTNQWKEIMDYLIFAGGIAQAAETAQQLHTQMGWTYTHDAFVAGNVEIKSDGSEVPSALIDTIKETSRHVYRAGSYDTWKELVGKLNIEGFELHAFVALTGLSSVLMNYTPTSGVTLSLVGDSGVGKTGSLYAALSMWGMPKDMSVLETTPLAVMGRFLSLHNLPYGLDEVGAVKGQDLGRIIHWISQGKAKLRMQASTNAERTHENSASLIGIFTTNHSIVDKIYSSKQNAVGEMARLIEFFMKKPKLLKDDPSQGRVMFHPLLSNHGWAGPEFVKGLYIEGKEAIDKRLDYWANKFKKDFGDDTAYRFYESLVATTMVAGEVADKYDILHYDLDRIYRNVVAELIDIRDNVHKTEQINYVSTINEFVQQNLGSVLLVHEEKHPLTPHNALLIRVDNDARELCLSKPAFRKFLVEDKGVSPKQFVFQLQEENIGVIEKRKKLAAGWKPGLDEFNVQSYIIDMNTLPPDVVDNIISKEIETESI